MPNILSDQETILLIADLEEKLLDGFKRRDLKILDLLFADGMLFHDQYGNVLDKEMDLDVYRSGMIKITKINVSKREIRVFESIVIVSASLFIKGSYLNILLNGKYQWLRVWGKVREDWKVISASCTSISV
ncbi:nuclear transport factor 2 family protein [Pedobacter sp. ISL-68]|uniref:nuclear transport factor 2 family protein n=1 Tax=unclassified Pedobacter TaxID=2628915 RepID=UPI001BEC1256|nr:MULTISPECIES: nuclear transport factor 2 family protein [unclassified Pedobacter]MBT2561778.1 nuclear transport factor 2 family protein [Pedobacter sp. ISL-64]MBT2591166.1 nuclear transport factor 2 family protein [Pedobacter sp. ISL-68]